MIWNTQAMGWLLLGVGAAGMSMALVHRYVQTLIMIICGGAAIGLVIVAYYTLPHPPLVNTPDPESIGAARILQQNLAVQNFRDRAIDDVLAHWDILKERGAPDDGGEIAQHARQELRAIQQSVRILALSEGNGLVIQTAPNTFRVTFPVVMRAVPGVIPRRLPAGITDAKTIEATRIGATIIYAPMTVPVDIKDVDLFFNAEF